MDVRERGDITFVFRPKVQPADLDKPAELGVQSFFIVLSPAGRSESGRLHLRPPHGRSRRIRIGRKRLPISAGERFWARVERVGSLQRVIGDQIEAEHYTTKTRGERYQPGARIVGRGSYAFLRHDDHTHLVYQLEDREDDAPDDIQVPDLGDYLVLFERIPRRTATWTAEGDPSLLDEEGAELVLVGHSENLEQRVVAQCVQPAG